MIVVKWEMSIGYPSAKRKGKVEIDPEDLEGLDKDARDEVISQAIWDDAMQYVDVYPVEIEEEDTDA